MEFDFESIKGYILENFYKNKKIIYFILSIFIFSLISLSFFIRNDYVSRENSSKLLFEYMNNENEDFLKQKHKKGYGLILKLLVNKNNPDISVYDEFSKLDDFVFKNLFYFSKKIVFDYKDDYDSYYSSKSNPWSKLMLLADIFNSKKIKNYDGLKDDYITNYLVGKGVKC